MNQSPKFEPRYHPTSFGQKALLCEAYTRLGLKCGLIAVKGSNPPRCFRHSRKLAFKNRIIDSSSTMARWYKKKVGPKLESVINESLEASIDEQLAVFEEIALIRESAGTFVNIHSTLLEAGAKPEALAASAMAMQQALAQVVEVCTKATKAHDKIRTFSALDIQNIVAQITQFLWEVCGMENKHIVERFLQLMEERLVLPTNKVEATDLKVNDTVTAMDSSIPYVADEDES